MWLFGQNGFDLLLWTTEKKPAKLPPTNTAHIFSCIIIYIGNIAVYQERGNHDMYIVAVKAKTIVAPKTRLDLAYALLLFF